MPRPVVIASNRGPVSFVDEGGRLGTTRGGGGLVTALGPAVGGTGATWIAAARSDADRRAAAGGAVDAGGHRVRLLDLDADTYRAHYEVVSNSTLWFLNHGLFDAARRPRFDRHWRRAWDAYRSVNATFSDAIVDEAPDGAIVLVHDYHLALVGPALAARRPDVSAVYFHHTPFCPPQDLRVLPEDAAAELMEGLAGFTACGFHATRWAEAFGDCCASVGMPAPTTFVAPAPPDVADLERVASSDACAAASAALETLVGDRLVLARVDRIELSKNLLRGFLAYEDLLAERPEWRERVVFVANAYPSREGLVEYLAYRSEVEGLVRRINETWGTPGWTPIVLDTADDFPRSVATLRRADVLVVNPVRDGLNLVALEGPLVNVRDAVLVLSREAGVAEQLEGAALLVNPFDVAATSDALHTALSMSAADRAAMAAEVRRRALARTPSDWFADQIAAAGAPS